ncbi:hypothetical protein TRFO_31500 [Tritrichomonas foetus]|uniref:Uncharacterized protein n=1 Tax=Tritrichomonas foetus TaxID=1144522 RepID=A0A1J4JVS1_9EUKA|nr:hypothetical protein TRFO_31500 [Tritrichomonas foetus]|eukprot:OHT01630.1 hypothetical protein TRFO_31500 [Tritrichomonas foetus]
MTTRESKWAAIIILNNRHEFVDMYPLDNSAKLMVKMKRQKRRDLGRLTGGKGISQSASKAKKKILEMFPDLNNRSNKANSHQIMNQYNNTLKSPNINQKERSNIGQKKSIINEDISMNDFHDEKSSLNRNNEMLHSPEIHCFTCDTNNQFNQCLSRQNIPKNRQQDEKLNQNYFSDKIEERNDLKHKDEKFVFDVEPHFTMFRQFLIDSQGLSENEVLDLDFGFEKTNRDEMNNMDLSSISWLLNSS